MAGFLFSNVTAYSMVSTGYQGSMLIARSNINTEP